MKVSFYTLRDCQRSIEELSNKCYFSDIVNQELCNECYWSGDGLCDSTLLTSSSLGFNSQICYQFVIIAVAGCSLFIKREANHSNSLFPNFRMISLSSR